MPRATRSCTNPCRSQGHVARTAQRGVLVRVLVAVTAHHAVHRVDRRRDRRPDTGERQGGRDRRNDHRTCRHEPAGAVDPREEAEWRAQRGSSGRPARQSAVSRVHLRPRLHDRPRHPYGSADLLRPRLRGPAIACKAKNFKQENFATLLGHTKKRGGSKEVDTEELLELYQNLSVEDAVRTMRFWRVRTQESNAPAPKALARAS